MKLKISEVLILVLLALFITVAHAEAAQSQYYSRSTTQVHRFMRLHKCPSKKYNPAKPYVCPGHVVDHKEPLACGGRDHPSNMQYQTMKAAKAKDKVERTCCSKGKRVCGKPIR